MRKQDQTAVAAAYDVAIASGNVEEIERLNALTFMPEQAKAETGQTDRK